MATGDYGMGSSIAGAITSAAGAYASATARKSALRLQAILDGINAQTAERGAQSTLAVGQHAEQNSMLQTAQLKSTQQAEFASHGVDLGEGSAARVLTSTDVMGAIDKNTIAANATRAAWGYRTQAVNDRNAAMIENASASAISPLLSASTSLLGGAGQVASSWYSMNKTGMYGQPGATADGMTIMLPQLDAGTSLNSNMG